MPEEEQIKINCDGVFDPNNKSIGTGIIVRNCEGMMVEGANGRLIVASAQKLRL